MFRRTIPFLISALLVMSCSSDDDGAPDGGEQAQAPTTTTTEAPGTTVPEPLDDQTPPPSINGITVDGDTIWVASIAGDEVLQVDRETGAILARFATDGAGPDDVAVGPDGSVYVAGFENGDLGRILEGSYSVIAELEPAINPIDVGSDGTVYVATMAAEGVLYRVSPDGSEVEVVAEGLSAVNGFEVDDDGTVLAPSIDLADPMAGGWIVRIDPVDGSVTTVAEGLPPVLASTVSPDGGYVALANLAGEVLAVDVEAGTFEVVVTLDSGAPFDNLAYADDGTLYLSSFIEPTITAVTPSGDIRQIPIGGA